MIEFDRAIYLEDDTSTSQGAIEIMFKERPICIPMPIASVSIIGIVVD